MSRKYSVANSVESEGTSIEWRLFEFMTNHRIYIINSWMKQNIDQNMKQNILNRILTQSLTVWSIKYESSKIGNIFEFQKRNEWIPSVELFVDNISQSDNSGTPCLFGSRQPLWLQNDLDSHPMYRWSFRVSFALPNDTYKVSKIEQMEPSAFVASISYTVNLSIGIEL